MTVRDEARDIRQGEEFDYSKVEQFLKDTVPALNGDMIVRQFPQGFSNLTYQVVVGDRDMVLRRPPFGSEVKTAHDMGREYKMLKALRPVFPYCPEPLAYTEDKSIMGCPFYVMERISGIILRKDLPDGLHIGPEQMTGLCEKLLDVHLELHSIDYKSVGLDNFGKPAGYVKRQVEGWSRRYRNARTDDAPDFENVMTWIAEKIPPDSDKPSVIHNDYRFDNVVLDENNYMNIIGVLDWEMATVGDPLMDLGNALAYWVQESDPDEFQMVRMMPTTVDGALTREEMVARYAEKSGTTIQNFDYYLCFGLFRLAVIGQQIYYRYKKGLTKDERFALLIFGIHILEKAALSIIENSKL
ncbi:MAG: phosphotransferase family protein [Proteobacteria bacterium]|nr:phosphotransferase family protein [Pseudomonadota bacterium]